LFVACKSETLELSLEDYLSAYSKANTEKLNKLLHPKCQREPKEWADAIKAEMNNENDVQKMNNAKLIEKSETYEANDSLYIVFFYSYDLTRQYKREFDFGNYKNTAQYENEKATFGNRNIIRNRERNELKINAFSYFFAVKAKKGAKWLLINSNNMQELSKIIPKPIFTDLVDYLSKQIEVVKKTHYKE